MTSAINDWSMKELAAHDLRFLLEVEGVNVLKIVKGVGASKAEEQIECQDQDISGENDAIDVLLVGDGSDEGGQTVVTHERVDTDTEKIGQTRDPNCLWSSTTLVLRQCDGRQCDHRTEGPPPEQRRQDLHVLCFADVEVRERNQCDENDGTENSIRDSATNCTSTYGPAFIPIRQMVRHVTHWLVCAVDHTRNTHVNSRQ